MRSTRDRWTNILSRMSQLLPGTDDENTEHVSRSGNRHNENPVVVTMLCKEDGYMTDDGTAGSSSGRNSQLHAGRRVARPLSIGTPSSFNIGASSTSHAAHSLPATDNSNNGDTSGSGSYGSLTRMFSNRNLRLRRHPKSSKTDPSDINYDGRCQLSAVFGAGLGIKDIYLHNNDSGRGLDVVPYTNRQGATDFLRRLPPEVALHLLSFTNGETLRHASRVNRYWYRLANDNELWRRMYYRNPGWKTRLPPRPPKLAFSLCSSEQTVGTKEDESEKGKGKEEEKEEEEEEEKEKEEEKENEKEKEKEEPSVRTTPTPEIPSHFRQLYRTRQLLENRWLRGDLETHFLQGHSDSVYCVQLDGDRLLTGSRDRTIRQWDLRTGQCIRVIEGHSASVLCLCAQDQCLVTGSSDCTARVWLLPSFKHQHRLIGHTAGVLDVCFDDRIIVTCSKDSTVRVWSREDGHRMKTLSGHRGPVNAVQMAGGLIVSASGDATMRVWDARTFSLLRVISGHARGLACVRFDGQHIVSGSNDRTIRVWDVTTGDCIQEFEGHQDLVRSICFNERWIVSGSYDLTVKVWDRQTGRQTLDLQRGHTGWIFDVQFDHSKIVSVGQDKKIVVWDFGHGQDLSYIA